jgi:hypothetical protein
LKTKLIISALTIVFFLSNNFSPNNYKKSQSNLNYYPFNIGNKWVFREANTDWENPPSTINRIWKLEIVKDTILNNGKKYRQLLKSVYNPSAYNELIYERIDTLNQKVYRYNLNSDSTNYERIVLDFTLEVGDTIYSSGWMIISDKKDSTEYFAKKFSSIGYSHIYGYVGYGDHYLENIGLYKYTYAADFFSSESFLKGCLIDNNLYGDTIITSSTKENITNPSNVIVYQNYPNPFNNTTIISFYLPLKDEVIINIYDNLGREVRKLIDREMGSGLHNIEFDATGLSTGIYFYKVNSNKFSEIRKFVVLK